LFPTASLTEMSFLVLPHFISCTGQIIPEVRYKTMLYEDVPACLVD
jgi:hypothetical protein